MAIIHTHEKKTLFNKVVDGMKCLTVCLKTSIFCIYMRQNSFMEILNFNLKPSRPACTSDSPIF